MSADDNTAKLLTATENGNVEDVKVLLKEKAASPSATYEDGLTVLMQAAYKGHLEICRLLIENGASVNAAQDSSLYTALMMACLAGKIEIVQLFLDHGADVTKTNSIGKNAVQLASFTGQHDIANLMRNYLSLDKLNPYVESQGAYEARLPKSVAPDVQKLISGSNPHPVKIILFIMDSKELYNAENMKIAEAVLSDLMRKCVRSKHDFDEILALKLHYYSSIVSLCLEHMKKKNTAQLDLLVKQLLHSNDEGFQVAVETIIRKSILGFPYTDFPLMQQFVKTIHPVKIGSNPTSLSCLVTMFSGMQANSLRHNVCETCAENASPLRCSACKKVCYCSKRCQKLHWFVHKKFCKKS